MTAVQWIVKRLNEPSTWAGLGVIAVTAGPYIEKAAHASDAAGTVIALLSGVIAAIKSEQGAK